MGKGYNGHGRWNCCEILFQPVQLYRIQMSIVPRIFKINIIQTDKMDTSIIEGVIIRTEVMMIHFFAIKRMIFACEGQVTLDPEIFMIPRDTPYWLTNLFHLTYIKLVITR